MVCSEEHSGKSPDDTNLHQASKAGGFMCPLSNSVGSGKEESEGESAISQDWSSSVYKQHKIKLLGYA